MGGEARASHYIRRPDSALIAAADKVGARIWAAMEGKSSGDVVLLRKPRGNAK